jgi:hypothetical protein
MPDDVATDDAVDEEQRDVLKWRQQEALSYGLTLIEARLYAESGIDCGQLRHLVDLGYTPEQIAKLLF